jgi:hypothetical protein
MRSRIKGENMNKRFALLTSLAIVATAFAAFTAAAAADEFEEVGETLVAFSASAIGNTVLKTGGLSVTCKKSSSTGELTSGTTGKWELTFSECTNALGTKCKTVGQPEGVITSTSLPFDVRELNDTNPGILVTPAGGGNHFVSFECGALIKAEVTGNGLLGRITSPACGKKSNSVTVSFTETGGTQTYKKIAGSGTEFDLSASINGGAPATATAISEQKWTFAGGKELTLKC